MAGNRPPVQLHQQADLAESNADFQKGMQLNQVGRGSEALAWFEKAAKAGHPLGTLTFASALAHGQFIKGDPVRAIRILQESAKTHPICRSAVASAKLSGFGTSPDWTGAISLLIENAEQGYVMAIRQLGTLLLLANNTELGVQLLLNAASQNDIIAQSLLLRHLAEHHLSHPDESRWMTNCLQVRHPTAAEFQAALLSSAGERSPFAPAPDTVSWQAVEEALKQPPRFDMKKAEVLHKSPDIAVLEKLIPGAVTETILALAAPQMQPAMIFDPNTGVARQDPYRRAGAMTFRPFNQDPVISVLDRVLTDLGGFPLKQGEQIGVLSYQPGQEYRPHYDCFTGDDGLMKDEMKNGGQRVKTVLLTLTDGYQGGATEFPRLDITAKAPRGSIISFDNVNAQGAAEELSLHAGLPLTSGAKWMATKWIRAKPYNRVG